jgi:hypothetical protein
MSIFFILILIILVFYAYKFGGVEKKNKNAFVTLLMLSDSYLPGVMNLGMSINTLYGGKKPFDMVCAVDKNVSKEARKVILTQYDKLFEIGDFSMDPNNVNVNLSFNENRENIKILYSVSLRKLEILNMVEYDKIIFCDADTVIFSKKFFEMFKLNTPAANIFSEVSALETRVQKSKYGKKAKREEWQKNGDFLEATLLVLSPKIGEYEKLIDFAKNNPKMCSSDTFCITNYWEHVNIIDKKYVSRYLEREIISLDPHGSDYKPWFKEAKYYKGVWTVWAKIYEAIYICFMQNTHKLLDEAYEKCRSMNVQMWPRGHEALTEFFYKHRRIEWHKLFQKNLPNRRKESTQYWL